MESPFAVSAIIFLILGVALVVAGIALGKRIPRAPQVTLIGVGGLILLGMGYLLYQQIIRETHDDVVVSGVTSDDHFAITVEHERVYTDGVSYVLRTDSTWDDVVAIMEAKYPEGAPVGDDAWELISATTPVLVFVSAEPDGEITLVSQTAFLRFNDNAEGVSFAYPSGRTANIQVDNGVAWAKPVNLQELRSYYENVDGAVITENSITVSADQGTVLIDFTNGETTATYTANN
ncbi:hypothetical protein [Jonesia quinghaiensis]|uniref:hypothetical protein n=1 Tax=Jonesia quinghaiensis TaxID=262806 RepID=UPI000410DC28|nr:hypothetical protein [Jonesia quinghaiensis]